MTDLDRQIDPDYPVKKRLSLYHAYNQGKFIGVHMTTLFSDSSYQFSSELFLFFFSLSYMNLCDIQFLSRPVFVYGGKIARHGTLNTLLIKVMIFNLGPLEPLDFMLSYDATLC